MRRTLAAAPVVASLLMLCLPTAHAGGVEYTGQGAQSLARGGAVAARAEDPMVLAHNPAGLVELRGSQFLLNVNLALFDACVDPLGFYGWTTYLGGQPSELPGPEGTAPTAIPLGEVDPTASNPADPASYQVARDYYNDPLDRVCLNQNIIPIPQMAWTRRISERFGIGFGLIFPAAQPGGRWGGRYGVITGDTGERRPAPTRYMMLQSSTLGVFPNFGLAYRFSDMFRAGLSFEWGIIAANVKTMAGSVGGTIPANDVVAHVKAQDYFIPAFTASVHLVPMDALDLVVAFRFQDDVDARGDVDLTTGLFDPQLQPNKTSNIPITSLKQSMPWKLRAGVRYADRLAPRPTGTGEGEADLSSPEVIHDPLQDERWDVELDVEWQMNGRNERQRVEYEVGHQIFFVPTDPMGTTASTDFPHPSVPQTIVQKNWQDQLSVRLGGTYNIFPGKVGVSAGAHYENRGIDPAYMHIDFWPVARLGLHTGVIVRLAKRLDLVVSYGHIFQETITVSAPFHRGRTAIDADRQVDGATPGQINNIDKTVGVYVDRMNPPTGTEILVEEPPASADGEGRLQQNLSRSPSGQPPAIVNSGTYTSSFDVFAAGINVHF